MTNADPQNLTEEEIMARLAGESVRGPRTFRGRELATYSPGLRDLCQKVVRSDDTSRFHDMTVVYLLTEAHGSTVEERVARRRRLLSATDDVEGFRARLSVEFADELSDAEVVEIRLLVDDILKVVELAQVQASPPVTPGRAPGKKKGAARSMPNPTAPAS